MTSIQEHLRLGEPIWTGQTPAPARFPSLVGAHETEVVIVGGGMTGALVAQAFASAGVGTILLEAGRVARGSTAASSALLLQEPDVELVKLEARYGRRAGRRIWRVSADSVTQLVRLFQRLGIDAGVERRRTVYYATRSEEVERLRLELRVRTDAGFAGEWLGVGGLRRLTGIPGRGAILTRGSAQFDPYRACLGVLRSASAEGAQIFERSAVTSVAVRSTGVRVRTRRATVDARRVIIATGYATAQFRPLVGRFRLFRTYVVATRPVPSHQRREIGLGDVMVWDTGRPYHYARWTADHRLLLGGGDRALRPGPGRQRQLDAAARDVRRHFEAQLPGVASIESASVWEGLFAITPDGLPFIGPHPRYPGHWFALGYGGNGMTFAFLAARLLLARWMGDRSADHALFAFDRLDR